MPEEKYGDIDVNPIETSLDSKNITLKETPAASGESFIDSNDTLVSKETSITQGSSESMNESEISDKLEVTDSEAAPSLSETNFDMKPEAEPSEEKAKITPEVTLEPEVAVSPEITPELKKSKSKKGLIAGIITASLVVGCGVVAITYNLPEKVAADAITGYVKQANKQMRATGSLAVTPRQDSELHGLISNIRLDFKADTNHFNNNTEVKFNIDLIGGQTLDFTLTAFVKDDGVIYLNAEKLNDALEKAKNLITATFGGEVSTQAIFGLLQKTFGNVEGKWWRIDVNEIVSSQDDTISQTEKQEKQEFVSSYNCLVCEIKKELEHTDRLAESYLKNPFLKIKSASTDDLKNSTLKSQAKDAGVLYKTSVDSTKLLNFMKNQQKLIKESGIPSCFKHENKQNEDPSSDENSKHDLSQRELTEEDAKKIANSLQNVYLGVDFLTHQLKALFISGSNNDFEYSGVVKIEPNKAFTLNTPANSHSVTELVDNLTKNLGQDVEDMFKNLVHDQESLLDELDSNDDKDVSTLL